MIEEADGFIQDHFVFIDDDPTGGGDEDLTLEWLLIALRMPCCVTGSRS